jgi:prepilin-type N-terminal cleavage/methylation domain-containing protein
MRRTVNKQAGFTLIELVIVIALVGIASFILVDMFIGQNKLYRTQTAELNITNDARMSLDEIDSYVRQAIRTLSSYSGYNSGPQTLVLQIQSVNSSNQLIAGTYDHVVFYMSGSNLMRQVFPDSASSRQSGLKRLASNVAGFTFTYDNADFALVTQITTDITIQESAGYQDRTITISSKSKLRNY